MINNLYIKATPAAASITWGSITGTLSSQTDLQNALDAKFDDPTGTVSQYVRGDGSLANFPASSGGGASLSFYLNGSVAQGTFGGVAFKEMDRTPILGAGTDFTIAANGYIQSFITDANVPNQLEIPAGNWNFETYFSASSSGGSPSFYVELYKWDGATLSLIASNSATPEGITNGTAIDLYVSALAIPQTTLAATDRLAVRIYVTHSGRTIKLHTENSHLCQVITTFSTGLTALNGLTAQVQNFATGTSGTDFGISSATSTHTFNLPTASAANRGALSSADWTTFNGKQDTLTLTTTGTSGAATLVGATLNIPQYSGGGGGNVAATHILTKPQSLFYYSNTLTQGNLNVSAQAANALVLSAFIPAYDLTINTLIVQVTTLAVGGLAKIAIYSDLNGVPHTKLLESTDVSTTTTGAKTITGFSFSFTAGTTYWIALVTNTGVAGWRSLNPNALMLAPVITTSNSTQVYTSWYINVTYASLPSTLTTPTSSNFNHTALPYIIFRAV